MGFQSMTEKGMFPATTQTAKPLTLWQRMLHYRYDLGAALSEYPAVYLPLVRAYCAILRRSAKVINRSTEIVIEGFPRSANSFASQAFEQAQDRPVELAHHVHNAANAMPAMQRGLPVIILLRAPDEAVLSYHAIWPWITPRQLFREYVRFYSKLSPVKDRCVVATFEQVTGDFGAVIRRVNARYGTNFQEFDHTAGNVNGALLQAADHGRRDAGSDALAGPNPERLRQKQQLRELIEAPELAELRQAAWQWYQAYLKLADA